jgi:hypothetical protein
MSRVWLLATSGLISQLLKNLKRAADAAFFAFSPEATNKWKSFKFLPPGQPLCVYQVEPVVSSWP